MSFLDPFFFDQTPFQNFQIVESTFIPFFMTVYHFPSDVHHKLLHLSF